MCQSVVYGNNVKGFVLESESSGVHLMEIDVAWFATQVSPLGPI